MAAEELKFEKFLGQGCFGSVSLIKYKGRINVAVKSSDDNKSLCEEFRILSKFKGCSRIVQSYGKKVQERFDEDKGRIEYMIPLEYASGGTLNNLMSRFRNKKLPDLMIRDFTRMLLEGLATVHQGGYVHCDLKPENILVFLTKTSSYELKISDFGLSKRDGDRNWWQPRRPFAGTPVYMSPESVSQGEISKGLDLWSLGCVVLEMYTGKRPWWHKNDLKDLVNGYKPLIPSELPCDAKFFLMTCYAKFIWRPTTEKTH